jgi:hypothetical protein
MSLEIYSFCIRIPKPTIWFMVIRWFMWLRRSKSQRSEWRSDVTHRDLGSEIHCRQHLGSYSLQIRSTAPSEPCRHLNARTSYDTNRGNNCRIEIRNTFAPCAWIFPSGQFCFCSSCRPRSESHEFSRNLATIIAAISSGALAPYSSFWKIWIVFQIMSERRLKISPVSDLAGISCPLMDVFVVPFVARK